MAPVIKRCRYDDEFKLGAVITLLESSNPDAALFFRVLHTPLPALIGSALLMAFMSARFANADFTGQETIWKQGTRLIESKKVIEGIRLLDSLRMSGYNDARFLSAYAGSVFRYFIPQKTDSGMPILQDALQHFAFDTTTPLSLSWNVSKSEQREYPSFQYKATFVCRKPFTLVFRGFDKMKMPPALLRYHEPQPPTSVQLAFAEQFSDRQDSANCTVCIDLNDTKSPLMEYIGQRINGVYDSIKLQNDLQKYHALSLRCYRRSFFLNGNDDGYAAYIVFDRTLADLQNSLSHKRRSVCQEANRKIRFTVAIRSGIDVQVFTEAKLQSILWAF
jgi:hypothetical protein